MKASALRGGARRGLVAVVATALLAFAGPSPMVAPADAAGFRYGVHTRSWDVPGKRVDRVGRERTKIPETSAAIQFGAQDGVPSGQVLVNVSAGEVPLLLRGPFDPDDRTRHDVELDPAEMRDVVLALAAPGFGETGLPEQPLVDLRRAAIRTRGSWRFRYGGFAGTHFLGVTEILKLRVRIVADVSDPTDPLARPVRVKTVFKGRYRKFFPAGEGDPTTVVTPPLCPWSAALAGSGVVRDSTQPPPTFQEAQHLVAADGRLWSDVTVAPLVSHYDAAIATIRARAGIGNVPISVVSDMRLAAPSVAAYGGGVAGHGFFVVDGKLLDVLSEFARYRALVEAGVAFQDDDGALNTIVGAHNQFVGAAPSGLFFTADALTSPQAARANELFLRWAAPIVYHEFGHVFLWNALDRLRATTGQLPRFFVSTSLNEDDADRVAGALTRKSGGSATDIVVLFDVLTFYALRRGGQVTTIQQVRSPQVQHTGSNTYSSPAQRKAIAAGTFHCSR